MVHGDRRRFGERLRVQSQERKVTHRILVGKPHGVPNGRRMGPELLEMSSGPEDEHAAVPPVAAGFQPRGGLTGIATRHDSHAALAAAALRAGKHVFVEKPLCIDEGDLKDLDQAVREAGDACLMVGFNRRFSRHAQAVRTAFRGRGGPMAVSYRVNAGVVAPKHWLHDPAEGGGRLLGEVCHCPETGSPARDSGSKR